MLTSFLRYYNETPFLQQRAIVTPYNETVGSINDYMLFVIPGEPKTYLSCDTILKSSSAIIDQELLYPLGFMIFFFFYFQWSSKP